MSIQWFPGHMHLTRKAIEERVKTIDVVIEMVDARLPASSANPMLRQLLRQKPALMVLNKADLADPNRTTHWLDWYQNQQNTAAIAMDSHHKAPAQALINACQQLKPNRGRLDKPMRVLICGIPNVGKSTLINTMVGRRAAKAANEPGVTRQEQRFVLEDGFYLFDTPGVLWPKIIVAQSGYNLAAAGSIGRNAFDDELVALALLQYLQQHYLDLLQKRYPFVENTTSLSDEAWFEQIGKRRGALLAGAKLNRQKTAEVILQDFRNNSLGHITLETPEEYVQWLKTGEHLDAEKQLQREEYQKERKKRYANKKNTRKK